MSNPNTIVILGHSLAAPENRLAFAGWKILQPILITPHDWPAYNLGVNYSSIPMQATNQSAELKTLSCYLAGKPPFFIWKKMDALLLQLNPTLIYSWEEPWCLSTWQACRFANRHHIPFVFFSAENRLKKLPPIFNAMMHYVFRRSVACIVPTESISENIFRLGFTQKRIDVPLWLAPRVRVAPDYTRKTLAYIGRLIPLKRVDSLLEALTILTDFHLRIIGDGPERERLIIQADALGISHRVEFRDYVPHSQLEQALIGCGCLVLPTNFSLTQAEQFGKAALEAVLCGFPVIVSESGQLKTWSQLIHTVTLVSPWSATALADAVRSLFKNPPSQEKLETAAQWVSQQFRAENVGRKMENQFSKILDSTP